MAAMLVSAPVSSAIVLLLSSFTDFGACSPEMRALQETLLGNYSVHVRPVQREEHVLHVNVSVFLLFLLDLDLKAQTLKSSGYMDVMWRDEYLVWKPDDFANITDILMPQNRLWLPDLVISNDVQSLNYFGNDKTLVNVRHDGTVTWQPDFVRETGCGVDIYKYPFDTQECPLTILPWMNTRRTMQVSYGALHTADAVINGEFLVTGTRVQHRQFEVTFSSETLAEGSFYVSLQRRYSFYLLSTVVPLAAFSLLSPLALLVPADSGEKITLSVTVLLANLVFMGSLSDSMPRVADTVSVFVLYASLQILLSFTAVIVNVAALCIARLPTTTTTASDNHHDSVGDRPQREAEGRGGGNFVSRQLRLLYLSLLSPRSTKDISVRHHPQLKERAGYVPQSQEREESGVGDTDPRPLPHTLLRGGVLRPRLSLSPQGRSCGRGQASHWTTP